MVYSKNLGVTYHLSRGIGSLCCLLTIASQEVCGKYRADGVGMGTADPWQVDVIKLLPSSEGYKYAITCVDMATGLLAAYPI